MILESKKIKLELNDENGAIVSFINKKSGKEMVTEKRLARNFSLNLKKSGNADGMKQKIKVMEKTKNRVSFKAEKITAGEKEFDIGFTFNIEIRDDRLIFTSDLENNSSEIVSSVSFPGIGGWTNFNGSRDPKLAMPEYMSCEHHISLFRNFPGAYANGMDGAVYAIPYPGIMMPWWDIYDEKDDTGLYMGYHDKTFRVSQWVTYLHPMMSGRPDDAWISPEEAEGVPVGLTFFHSRFPEINPGESFSEGEFIMMIHDGDWHYGSRVYRDWFLENFPLDHKKDNWLRKESAWFTSILYQPEDKIIAGYDTYAKWCSDAKKYNINCCEIIGWDKGGLERDFPEYEPAEILGGRKAFRKMLKTMKENGSKSLVFVNYNTLDTANEMYKNELHKYVSQDPSGLNANWMCWGESTLTARTALSVNRQLICTITDRINEILQDYFVELARDGADGFQIDKLCVGTGLDYNPLAPMKPDVVNAQGMVDAIDEVFRKCREINPEFCMGSEATQDRLLPYIDVFYRCAIGHSITPLRYLFPECTACAHISMPYDYNGINGAVLSGAVICLEPESYQDTTDNPVWQGFMPYVKEVERIRGELKDIVFTGRFHDTLEAWVEQIEISGQDDGKESVKINLDAPGIMFSKTLDDSKSIYYGVHESISTGKKAIIVINNDQDKDRLYKWGFEDEDIRSATLYRPFEQPVEVRPGKALEISKTGLHIIVEN